MRNPSDLPMIGHGLDAVVIKLNQGKRHEWTPAGRIVRYQEALIYADKSHFDFREMKGELMQRNLALHSTCVVPDPIETTPEPSPVVVPFDQQRRTRRKR